MEPNPIIEFLASESVSSFTLQLLATLFGAFVGFGLIIGWDRRKKKTERREAKILMIDSLVAELKENLEGLNNYQMPSWTKEESKFRGEFGLASVYAFQSIVSGGNFGSLPVKLQKSIRVIYQNSELFNKFMDDVIHYSTLNLADNQDSIATTELINRLREQKTQLQTKLPDTIKDLKSLRKKEIEE